MVAVVARLPPVTVRLLQRWRVDNSLRVRVLVVSGTLLASAILARSPTPTILVIVGALATVAVVVRWSRLGLPLLAIGGLLLPMEIPTGTETRVNAAVVLTGALLTIWVVGMLVRGDLRLARSRPIVPAIVFGVVSVLAFVVGVQPWQQSAGTAPLSSQLGGLAIYLLSVAAFLLAAHRIDDVRWLERVCWLYLAWAAIYMVHRLPFASVLPFLAPRGADYSVFWVWVASLSFSQGLLNTRLRGGWRTVLLGLAALTLYVGLSHRSWNSGWVPPLAAMLAIVWLGAPRIAPFLTLVGLLVLLPNAQHLSAMLLDDKNRTDLVTRVAAWRIVWDIIRLDPVLGTGFANYYYYTPLYSFLGSSAKLSSHNNYFDLVAQTGFVGIAVFGWLMAEISRLAWRLRQQAAAGFARAYACGALGGVVGMLVAACLGDWILPFVYNIGLAGFRSSVQGWLFLGGLVAIEQQFLAVQARASNERLDG